MTIEIRLAKHEEIEAVRQLLARNGWAYRVADTASFGQLINNSDRCIVALESDTLVGFVRGITDHTSNGYISMVVVAPDYRNQGIGRKLVEELTTKNTGITWVLRASRDGAKEFFAHLGFVLSTDAMELTPQ